MILYHFTCLLHLPKIREDGVITTTESNIGSPRPDWPPTGEHHGPDVVWLTTEPKRTAASHGLDRSETTDDIATVADKTAVRIKVQVPDDEAFYWPDWARDQGIDDRWFDLLGRGRRPDLWWVVTRPVPESEWLKVAVRSVSVLPSLRS